MHSFTYYTYINKLRIEHFQTLYREALKENATPKLQQLSADSGFASYNTFSRAFVACIGISVRKWMEQENFEERRGHNAAARVHDSISVISH